MPEETPKSATSVVDKIPALVWSALSDGSRDFHNRRWLEFTGLTAEQAVGDGWVATVHPEDRTTVLTAWRSAVATGKSFQVEARARSASGEYRWFLVRAEPCVDEKGTIAKWYGSAIDIEDRKRAEEALRESESQWREVFEHNPVMYFMVDANGIVLSVNAFGAAQLGYEVGELVGHPVLNVFLEEDRPFVLRNMGVCLDKPGQSHSWEVRKIRKNGTLIWVRENAKAVRRPNGYLVLVACEDITERRKTEDALRQSEMYLAEAQRISHTGSFSLRVASGELVWSAETFRIFECDPAIKPSVDFVLQRTHPDDRSFLRQFLDRVACDEKDWEVEHRLLMPDGRVKVIWGVARAARGSGGDLEFIGAVMDVTASRMAADELNHARAELAHVTRVTALGELSAAIAHEVNQPIAAMVTEAQAALNWLAREPPNLEELRQALYRIVKQGGRAADVIGRLRDLVKKAPTRKDAVDMSEAVQEVIALTRSEISGCGVSLQTMLSENLPLIEGDRVQLQQVLLNLIVNALQAMGSVGAGQRELFITTARAEPDGVLVSVQDSGPGLSPELTDRVFAPFYSTKPGGLGMGLSICRSIIEAHNGRLWVTANVPRGAIFHFAVPVHPRAGAFSNAAVRDSQSSVSGKPYS